MREWRGYQTDIASVHDSPNCEVCSCYNFC